MIYAEIFREFELKSVRYLVVGGMAVNLYGYVRLTMDLDILVDLSNENLSKIVDTMEKFSYTPRVPVNPRELISREKRNEWITEKKAVVFTFIDPQNPFKHVDIFLSNPINFNKAYSGREVITAGDVKINIVSMDDLITMKRSSGRPRDLEDAKHLERIKALKEEE